MVPSSRRLRRQLPAERVLPLMRNCFVGGATYAILLLQRGHGDQLLRDIAGFSDEASPPVPPRGL